MMLICRARACSRIGGALRPARRRVQVPGAEPVRHAAAAGGGRRCSTPPPAS
ncbi:MAG: hypothetical protein MZW92_81040 [Comamonadaceae bacterium]|nr:hypothetical protein [Comamonadaceae bacterium]